LCLGTLWYASMGRTCSNVQTRKLSSQLPLLWTSSYCSLTSRDLFVKNTVRTYISSLRSTIHTSSLEKCEYETKFLIHTISLYLFDWTENRQCFREESKKVNCPVCNELIGKLAKDLPYAHHIHSRLVCRLSGELMNEDNPPMMLPNGQVYSKKVPSSSLIHVLSFNEFLLRFLWNSLT
jgi:hypothetical protein